MAKKNNKDKSLTNQYIRAIENPDSVGFNNGYWYQAPNSVFDANNRGFGIDVKYNKEAANLVKNRKGKYLTEEEERNLRNSYVGYLEGLLDDYTPPIANYPSDIKKAMATGLLYRGDGTKSIFKNPAMQSTYLFGTDNDFEKAVADYYKSKGLDERARLHTEFVDNQKPIEDKQIDWFSPAISVPMFSTLPEVEVVAKYPHEQRVIDTMNASNAEFMQRLRNNDKRAIHNPDGSYSTHVLGSADNIVFPAIQDVNGELKDYRAMPWQRTLDWAIRNKDYTEFPTEGDARYFGEHYKKYYPKFFNDSGNNQYAEGGELDAPKHWNELSLADKNDVMAAAISNSITSLDDIRQTWNDFADSSNRDDRSHRDDRNYRGDIEDREDIEDIDNSTMASEHEYAKGGYKPSAAIKSEIANWEGSSMKTNRSFEAEAADFNRVIPAAVRNKLTQKQLDALYSYGYNIGMGNLKARVLPTLTAYTQGRVDAGDVASSMWASKDPLMKGLQRRRAWERGMFTGEAPIERQGSIVDRAINMDLSHLPSMNFKGEINNPLIQHPYYTAPKVELPKEESKPVTLEGINEDLDEDNGLSNFFKVQQMMGAVGMDNGLSNNSFLGAWSNFLNGNVFVTGGQKGVTSSSGSYYVSPADYWSVANSAENNKPLEVTLPEVTVKAADPKNYRSSFHPEDTGVFFDTAMGPFKYILPNPFKGVQAIANKDYKTAGEEALKTILPMDNVLGHSANLALGIDQLVNENGIRKAYNHLENGEYGKAALSGAGDILNGLMAGYGAKGISNDILKRANSLSKHTLLFNNPDKENLLNTMIDFGNIKDGTFHFNGFNEDPVSMHIRRAKAKGYDTSDIKIYDLSKDTPETQEVIEDIAKQFHLTPEKTKVFLMTHLGAYGHAGVIKGSKTILHDGQLGDKIKAVVSHEFDHALHFPDEPVPEGTFMPRLNNLHGTYFSRDNNTEVAARGSQLHDYFGHTGIEPLTPEELQYAKYHYVKDTGINNDMNELLWSTSDFDKLAKWMSKYATGIVAPLATTNNENK